MDDRASALGQDDTRHVRISRVRPLNKWQMRRLSDGATVFVGSHDKKLYAIDAASGTQKWAFEMSDIVFSSPAISSDGATVFVGSYDGKLYAIDTANRTQKWAFKTGGNVTSPVLIE